MSVPGDLDGQRIDNFLHRELKGVPKTLVYRLLRRGEVRVNGGRAKPNRRLRAGDEVRIPPVRTGKATVTRPSDRVLERLEQAVLFEDDRVIVLDKPTGLAVHGGSGIAYGVIEALRLLRPDCRFLDLAHRIDRDTSGCLVVAKKRSALRALHDLFREGAVHKQYLALLRGETARALFTVRAPLVAAAGPGGERRMRVDASGKPAVSHFETLERLGEFTVCRVTIETGRMHQIRAHAAHAGLPLAGDDKYGGNSDAAPAGLKRLFLHAERLGLPETEHSPAIAVSAPLAKDLESVLAALRKFHEYGRQR